MINDVGSHKIWVARNFPGRCIITSNRLANMGIALPGAIAASLFDFSRQNIVVMEDGGFMKNSQELETGKRLGIQ